MERIVFDTAFREYDTVSLLTFHSLLLTLNSQPLLVIWQSEPLYPEKEEKTKEDQKEKDECLRE